MKKIFITCYLSLISCTCFGATTDEYRDALKKCDDAQTAQIETTATNADVAATLTGTSNCYVRVGAAVINEYYSDTAADMRAKFIAFANAAHTATGNIYFGPDTCWPECGHDGELMRLATTEKYIRTYVSDILNFIDTDAE